VPKKKEIIEELQFLSDKLSAQARTVAFGLLAITWTILVGESAFLRKLSEGLGKRLLLVAVLSIFVLFVDFLQYVVGYIYVNKTLKAAEAEDLTEADYDPDSWLRRLRTVLFWTKQFVLVVTLVVFLAVLACYINS
jgi:hypothetical protein